MLTIACLSQKGGVGKSTICRLIATAYTISGWKVMIADLHTTQNTSVRWAWRRLEVGHEPEIAVESFPSAKIALLKRNHFDLIVLDGRPNWETAAHDTAKVADLIIVPTSVSLDDLRPQVLFAHELIANGIEKRRILFVINLSSDSVIELADARGYIEQAGYQVCETDLNDKTGYRLAHRAGKAACETTFPSLNERAIAVARQIAYGLAASKHVPA